MPIPIFGSITTCCEQDIAKEILIEACLEAKQKFVVDNTNPTRAERAMYIEKARKHHFKVIGYYLKADIKEALERNGKRTGKAMVPEKGIRATYKKLELPSISEGFDELFCVTPDGNDSFVIEAWKDEI